MNYYIKTLLVVTVSVLCCALYAQSMPAPVTISKKQLIGTKWKLVEPASSRIEYALSFGETEVVSETYIVSLKKRGTISKKYYLSDSPSTVFDTQKVNSTNGAYIVTKNSRNNMVTTKDVMYFSLEEGVMILIARPAEGAIGTKSLMQYELIR